MKFTKYKFIIMKTLNIALVSVLLACLTACNNNPKKTASSTEASNGKTAVTAELSVGTFEGTMPAADCEGIRTILTVNADSTYTLTREYLGVKDGLFETSGIYHSAGNGLIELITPSSGEKTYFRHVGKGYMLSDSIGTVNDGELAELYILKLSK